MSSNNEDVEKNRLEEILGVYKKLSRTPFIEQGWVKPEQPTTVMIQYSQRDLPRNKKNRIMRSFFEGESFSFKPFPFAVNMVNVVLVEPSPSWKYLAVMRSMKEKGEEEDKYLLEIWDNGCIAAAIPTEGKHGQVYGDSWFGSLVWSSDEKYLAYIAEKNPPKTFAHFSPKLDSTSDENNKPKPGSKFELREDWGETYKGGNPIIAIASVEKESIAIVPGIPDNISAGQVQWAPENQHLVFTGWQTEPRRLGIVHCYNRPCAIYAIPIDVNDIFSPKTSTPETKKAQNEECLAVQLTLDNIVSRSPRFSRDGKILLYLASQNTSTHNSSSKLLTMNWIASESENKMEKQSNRLDYVTGQEDVIIDIVDKYPSNSDDFPGLFVGNLPARCFIEDRKVMFSSVWRSLLVPLLVDLETKQLRKLTIPGCSNSNLNVQDVRQDVCALFDGSEINRSPFNFVGRWDHQKVRFRDWKVTPHALSITETAIEVSELSWEIGTAPLGKSTCESSLTTTDGNEASVEYILTLPADAGDKKAPIILFPHGGPHSTSTPIFSISVAFFASLGYAVLNVNYRGSLGFGKQYVDALPGYCGEMDVNDCLSALQTVLKTHSDKIDSERVFVIGGSHGGFLSGHLLARNEVPWKAGVLINAVTNMAHCVGISDIPDWCYVESQSVDLKTGLQKMFEMSPISRIAQVTAPTLIVLGAADKRVPISQSIEYYHALKKQGVETKVLKYPGAGHAIAEPEQEADYLINSALWFEKFDNVKRD